MSLFSEKETVEFLVKGMHCEKCVARVDEALSNADGVTEVNVSLEKENAVVSGHGINADACIEAINALGFTASLA